MNPQHQDEWAIPQDPAAAPAVEIAARRSPKVTLMAFHHQEETHYLEISLWAVSHDVILKNHPQTLVESLTQPKKITVLIPMLEETVGLGMTILNQFYEDTERHEFITTPEKIAQVVDRIYGIGDFFEIGVMAAIGKDLKENCREPAQAACERILDLLNQERIARLPAI